MNGKISNLKIDEPLEVPEEMYRNLMIVFSGRIAGRKSADGKFYIKFWSTQDLNAFKSAFA